MKDSLFEILLNLFEKTLSQIQEKQQPLNAVVDGASQTSLSNSVKKQASVGIQVEVFKSPNHQSLRILTEAERTKFTKASYQFLTRMMSWGVVSPDVLEIIINRLSFSESRFVNLDETKWTIRNTLALSLSSEQLAFLDLLLYQREDNLAVH